MLTAATNYKKTEWETIASTLSARLSSIWWPSRGSSWRTWASNCYTFSAAMTHLAELQTCVTMTNVDTAWHGNDLWQWVTSWLIFYYHSRPSGVWTRLVFKSYYHLYKHFWFGSSLPELFKVKSDSDLVQPFTWSDCRPDQQYRLWQWDPNPWQVADMHDNDDMSSNKINAACHWN